MCGIAGLWAPRLDGPERLERVAAMVDRMRHRGPSGTAVWDGGAIALGLARLAIVDPQAPARIPSDERGELHAVVNGEIYNHAALRAELRGRGHELQDALDTAVVPHLYEEGDLAFPERLDGMFAIALWDGPRERLVLARDRAGEKPLFVARLPGMVAFASEPAALLVLPWVSRDPSPDSLARYLVHGFFAGSDCAFAAIRQVPPAHVVEIRGSTERSHRYWRPWDAPGLATPAVGATTSADAVRNTREHLARAIASRIPDDVPFGVFLSGGVDSGLVATLAARARGHRFPTFSLRIAHQGYDESPYAREVAASIDSEHHELTLELEGAIEALESWAAEMDQPLGDPSVLPTWALSRLASRHVPVVLTGEGGDELFAGYPTYLGHRYAGLADALPAVLATPLLGLVRRSRPGHHHVTIAHMLERFLGARGLAPFERHLAWFGTSTPKESLRLLAPALREAVSPLATTAHASELIARLREARLVAPNRPFPLLAYQLLDFETYLSGDLLTKVDRCTMAHGVESRAPFLAHDLIEFALALPESAKLRGKSGKWALKQAARDLLPASILNRRKQGFSPPFSTWARGPLRAFVTDRLSSERVRRAGVLDPVAVEDVVTTHLDGRAERGRTLWTLLSLQMWAERWLGATPAASDARVSEEALASRS